MPMKTRKQRSVLHGAKELDRLLNDLPKRLGKQELTNSLSAGASVVAKELRRSAPRGDEPSKASKTYGPLRKNIRIHRLRRTKSSAAVKVHNNDGFWGMFFEFGTSKMAARPWFRPAVERARNAAMNRFAERLAQGIDRQATALAGKYKTLTRKQRKALR